MFTHINFDITSVKSRLSSLIFDYFFLDTNGSRRASKKRNLVKEGSGFVSSQLRKYLEKNIVVDGGYCVLTIR